MLCPILRHLVYYSETSDIAPRSRTISPIRFRRFVRKTFKNRPASPVAHLSAEGNGHVRRLSTSRLRCQSDRFEKKTLAVTSTAGRGHRRCGCTKSVGALFKDCRSTIGKRSQWAPLTGDSRGPDGWRAKDGTNCQQD